jgi:translocation and assembly module TamB
MKRRRLVALVSAAVLLVIGIAVVAAVLVITRTDVGRRSVRNFVRPLIASRVKGGTLYIGHLGGNLITNLVIDSVAIRDKRGELLMSSGRIMLEYNPRDLIDSRIYITRASIEHPYVHLIQHENGVWNFKEIFASPSPQPNKPKNPNERNLGDYFVIDSMSTRDASFYLTLPWRPDERGAARDSVIRAHLANPAKVVTKRFDGYARTYSWTHARGFLVHARLADPDSDRKVGQEFRVDSLSVDEYEPTFKFRNVRADVRRLADSAWFQVPHFDMPASTGNGHGKVFWGSDNPIHYDIAIHGDSVALNDVNWVYPTLPRTGGGTLDLLIKNDPKNLQIVDFRLAKMDVRSVGSHVTGDMTFGTGAPLLLVQNVDLRADPVDFDLLRTLNGKPFAEDWQGRLIGTVKGRGGPLTHFVVDDARGLFEDAHVRGAVSRFAAHGELDILYPAFTAFHRLDVDVTALDLRTIEFLFPSFPRLKGFVSGTATLDSSWLDVRFSNAHLVHQDGPGEPSQMSGSGRVTYGDKFMTYDVALDAQPLSLTMLARSYPLLPFRGLMSGPIHAKGSSPDLEVATSLQGAAGAFSYDGHLDIDSVGGYAAQGRGQFSALNIAGLLEKPSIPEGTISGHYDVDLTGATVNTMRGTAGVAIERTTVDSIRVYPSEAHVRFADGRMIIDSLQLHTSAATLAVLAGGGIGLPSGRPDSLRFTLSVDSLGGLRRYVSHPDTTLLGARATLPDSLAGAFTVHGLASGTLDVLQLKGRLTANNLYLNQESAAAVDGTFDVRDLFGARSGGVRLRADTVVLAGVVLDTIGASLRMDNATHARFAAGALSRNGPAASISGTWTSTQKGLQSVIADSLGLRIDTDHWSLAAPARLISDAAGLRLDTLILRNRDSGVVVVSAGIPAAGDVAAQLRAVRIPLGELATLAQFRDSISGIADISANVRGTKAQPRIDADATLTGIRVHGITIDLVSANAAYAATRLGVTAKVVRGGQTALSGQADLPVEITLSSAHRLGGPLSGEVHADSTDLSLLGTLSKSTVTDVKGHLSADVRLSGTWVVPIFNGYVGVSDGTARVAPLGVTVTGINGRVSGALNSTGAEDSIRVDLRANNDKQPADSARLSGWFTLSGQTKSSPALRLSLVANQFHALSLPSLADLYISTTAPLALTGTVQAPTLTGSLRVDRGSIYLADADLARKLAVEEVPDSTTMSGGSSGSEFLSTLITNLHINGVTISLGDNVRLRSSEANVRLSGQLNLVTGTARSTRTLASGALVPRLELQGQLRTVDGTYVLPLGPVQREFTVLADGTVDFDGPPETPALDIKALYNVKQYRDRDIGVIVNLHGRMPKPTVSFASTADYPIGDSDLLSYLLTGRPGLDIGGANTSGAGQVLASVLAPTVSALAAASLRQNFGSMFDMLQFQLGATDAQSQNPLDPKNFGQYLEGATIGAEKQFGGNLYFNVNTGLCQFTQSNSGSYTALGSLGAKVEYRFDPRSSAQIGYDPPTANRICSRESQLLTGFQPTPGQFSFSLSHTWRF